MEKIFNVGHNEYSNNMVNLTINASDPPLLLK
jgi:hypothetical protein